MNNHEAATLRVKTTPGRKFHLSRGMQRVIAVSILAGGYFILGSITRPENVPASPVLNTPGVSYDSPGPVCLGYIQGGGYTIEITSAPDEPRYSVRDEAGNMIATAVTADELVKMFPDVHLPGMMSESDIPGDSQGVLLMLGPDDSPLPGR